VFGCKASTAALASPFAPAPARRGVVIRKTVRVDG
jgi:hypothetical protein